MTTNLIKNATVNATTKANTNATMNSASNRNTNRSPIVAAHRMLATSLLACSGLLATAHADTITVCPDGSCDFTDPVAAVNAAVTGDIVEIAAGTYPLASTLTVYGQAITIRGAVDAEGRPATVLDGQGARTVLLVTSVIGQPGLENLVLANGRSDYGGGAFVSGSTPVFRNCHFRDNVANWRGGAMFNSSASPTLIDCVITGNSAGNTQFPSSGSAGAVTVGSGTSTLIGCMVRQNASDGLGGAFQLSSSSTLVLESTSVCGNIAPTDPQFSVLAGAVVIERFGACVSDDCADCPNCPADLTGDGVVGAPDLATMLIAWGACGKACASDFDGDGVVGGSDLSILLSSWGACD